MPAPTTPDLTLSALERQRFDTAVTNAGLLPSTSWSNVINVTSTGPIPSNYVTTLQVTSLNQLNQIIGLPDSIFQDGGTPPQPAAIMVQGQSQGQSEAKGAPADAQALLAGLTFAQARHLKYSTDAFLFGDSSQPSVNASLVDAAFFPLTLTVVAAQSLTLAPGVTLNIAANSGNSSDPYGYVLLILGSLSIGAGALISSSANTVVNTQVAFSAND